MKNEDLHPSEELSHYFAPRREEASLLSSTEVETLLVRHDMLPNTSRTLLSVRNIIMTLTGLATLGGIAYLAFFNAPHTNTLTSFSKEAHSISSNRAPVLTNTIATPTVNKHTSQSTKPIQKAPERGPWSAGNDQFYADLNPNELKKLGIVVNGDTVETYKLSDDNSLKKGQVSYHYIGGYGTTKSSPAGIEAHHIFPELITFGNGNGAAWQTKGGGCAMIPSEINTILGPWLNKPGAPGYHALGFENHQQYDPKWGTLDTIRIQIGKDCPMPVPFPFEWPAGMGNYSDTVAKGMVQLGHYYEGSIPKPAFTLPKGMVLVVDTVTPQDILNQIAQAQNGETMEHLRSIVSRLNELVPVIVRMKPGSGELGKQDFILWYEPSDELFDALPQKQAALFRAKLAQPPHCLTAPNSALRSVEITYCVTEPQKVHLTIRDLIGKERISWDQDAVAGDNVAKCGTETLASGMYVMTVREGNGTERSRRIWIENANPKKPGWENANMKATQAWVTSDDDSIQDDGTLAPLNIPHLELTHDDLATIGVVTNDSLGSFYFASDKRGNVDCVELLRKWNPGDRVFSATVVQVGGIRNRFLTDSNVFGVSPRTFQPLLVTGGNGRKRLFTSDTAIFPFGHDEDPSEVTKKMKEIDQQFQMVDQLIPILLRANSTSGPVGARDLIFWYRGTPDFLASLPESSRLVAQNIVGNGNQAPVATSHGAISKVAAYPNPSKGKVTLKLSMNDSRSITVVLRNLLGQEVSEPIHMQASGESEEKLDFSKLPDGIYLLDITSEIGERYVQRIVIEH